MRKISILLIFLSISLTNPFEEFDKSFLYDNSTSELENLNQNTKSCINFIQESENEGDPIVQYLIANASHICSCIFEKKTDEFINNFTNSLLSITLDSWSQEWPDGKLKKEWLICIEKKFKL